MRLVNYKTHKHILCHHECNRECRAECRLLQLYSALKRIRPTFRVVVRPLSNERGNQSLRTLLVSTSYLNLIDTYEPFGDILQPEHLIYLASAFPFSLNQPIGLWCHKLLGRAYQLLWRLNEWHNRLSNLCSPTGNDHRHYIGSAYAPRFLHRLCQRATLSFTSTTSISYRRRNTLDTSNKILTFVKYFQREKKYFENFALKVLRNIQFLKSPDEEISTVLSSLVGVRTQKLVI